MATEIERIANRYEQRKALVGNQYSKFNPEVLAGAQERQRALVALLKSYGMVGLAGLDILEIGCGSGANLLELLLLGAQPVNLVGNELLPDRLESARQILPQSVRLFLGDASVLTFDDASFDIVYQSTVFTSILDDELQELIAEAMWRWVKPGGGCFGMTLRSTTRPILTCGVCRSIGFAHCFRRENCISGALR